MPAPLSGYELDQLVAPIALYPDALVAQILAGSTYPTEVVEAARWQSANPGLSGGSLAAAVDSSNWDPSIKAPTQFPSVLANMNNNLSWTSALGQAYYYQPADVLNAVQVMRQRALAARTLVNTPQQRYYDRNGMIMIEPVDPDEIYVPAHNPADIYGTPVAVYPGYSTGEMVGAGLLAFGAGVAVSVLANQAWGWHGWNTDWHHHDVIYQNNVYVSNTNNFASVSRYGGGNRGGNFNRPAGNNAGGPWRGARPAYKANAPAPPSVRNEPRPQASHPNPYRGFAKASATGLNKTVFAKVAPGGEAMAASARGRASLGRAPKPARAAPPAHAAARPAPRAAPAARPAAHATPKH